MKEKRVITAQNPQRVNNCSVLVLFNMIEKSYGNVNPQDARPGKDISSRRLLWLHSARAPAYPFAFSPAMLFALGKDEMAVCRFWKAFAVHFVPLVVAWRSLCRYERNGLYR